MKRFDLKFFKISEASWKDMSFENWMEIIKNKLGGTIDIEGFAKLLEEDRRLTIKFKIDPTELNIHIGQIVPIMLVKAFKKKGHDINIILGDFTAHIGEPLCKNTKKVKLTDERIRKNVKRYKKQIGMFIDINNVKIHLNSTWINNLTSLELVEYLKLVSLANITQRKSLKTRMKKGSYVSLAEVCYSTFMGIDSVAVNADIEIGGMDQFLNLMQCNDIMKKKGMRPQVALVTPILEGISNDGRKMAKHFGNTINILESDDEKFSKFMSIKDELILPYFKAFAFINDSDLFELEEFIKNDPNEAKKQLATYFIGIQHHNILAGENARKRFETKF